MINNYSFLKCPDKVWSGENFWAVPLEDWCIKNKRLECIGNRENMRVNLLTTTFDEKGNAAVSMQMGLIQKTDTEGKAGLSIGLKDETDNSIKLCWEIVKPIVGKPFPK